MTPAPRPGPPAASGWTGPGSSYPATTSSRTSPLGAGRRSPFPDYGKPRGTWTWTALPGTGASSPSATRPDGGRCGSVRSSTTRGVPERPGAGGPPRRVPPVRLECTGLVTGVNGIAVRVTEHPAGAPAHLRSAHGKQGWMNGVFPSPPSLYLTYGGIWQTVLLDRHGPARITDCWVSADPDDLTVEVTAAGARHRDGGRRSSRPTGRAHAARGPGWCAGQRPVREGGRAAVVTAVARSARGARLPLRRREAVGHARGSLRAPHDLTDGWLS